MPVETSVRPKNKLQFERKIVLRSLISTTYFTQLVEIVVTCFILLIAFVRPSVGTPLFVLIERALHFLGSRPRRSAVLLAAGVIICRLAMLPLIPSPRPAIHDEFSYLLAAQTFASGHLSNAPHPFWRNFESVHILQQPTYMSMYPPGQGLVLGAGLWLTGHAWAGVLLSTAILCSILFWALQAWLPASWALAGSLLASVRWCLVSYWMNSFWGGTVPALGGALVFGTIPRLASSPNRKTGCLLALGLILLANTRPYEGLVCALVSIAVLLVWSRRNGTLRQIVSLQLLLPIALLLVVAACGMLTYNARVTKKPLLLPYALDRQEYAIAPLFIWGHLRLPPRYNSHSLKQVYMAEAELYGVTQRAFGVPELLRKLKNIWIFYLGPLLTIPFIFVLLPHTENGGNQPPKRKYAILIIACGAIASLQVVWFYPHYLAPVFAPLVACLVLGLRDLRTRTWQGRATGLFLSRAIPLGCVLMIAVPILARSAHGNLIYWPLQWATGSPPEVHPPEMLPRLLKGGRQALVFVEYGPKHDPGFEWVYNDADIDSSSVVWARLTNKASDAALMHHFSGRNIWLLRPDERPFHLLPINSLAKNGVLPAGSSQ